MRAAELPSGNYHATATALAKVAAMAAGGGALGDVRLLSAEGMREAQAEVTRRVDALHGLPTCLSKGGLCRFGPGNFTVPGQPSRR